MRWMAGSTSDDKFMTMCRGELVGYQSGARRRCGGGEHAGLYSLGRGKIRFWDRRGACLMCRRVLECGDIARVEERTTLFCGVDGSLLEPAVIWEPCSVVGCAWWLCLLLLMFLRCQLFEGTRMVDAGARQRQASPGL